MNNQFGMFIHWGLYAQAGLHAQAFRTIPLRVFPWMNIIMEMEKILFAERKCH